MAHAYVVAGNVEENIQKALGFGERELGFALERNSDVVVLRFGLFSVEDARKLIDSAYRSAIGNNGKVIIVSMTRVFHEAQNALLKLLEEPPEGVTLILCIPSAGILLPTLHSRILSLPQPQKIVSEVEEETCVDTDDVQEFLHATMAERDKIIVKLLDRTKSDKDEVKQVARNNAIELIERLLHVSYRSGTTNKGTMSTERQQELRDFEDDLSAFLPILHERSAPLKLIFEHILLVIPKSLASSKV